jgi:hypothetical protein
LELQRKQWHQEKEVMIQQAGQDPSKDTRTHVLLVAQLHPLFI